MEELYHKKINGAAMMYAIFVMIVITIICTLIVGLNLYRNHQNNKVYFRLLCENNVNNGLVVLMKEPEIFPLDKAVNFSLFGYKNDSVLLKKEQWGIFNLLIGKSNVKTDTITRAVFAGNYIQTPENPVLVLAPSIKTLKIGGSTCIKGKTLLPGGYITSCNIENTPFTGSRPDNSSIDPVKSFPAINQEWKKVSFEETVSNLSEDTQNIPINYIPATMSVGFDRQSQICLLSGDSRIENSNLNGKIAIVSEGKITIAATALLEDILIIGGSVVVEKGFSGTVQIMARDSICIEENCQLQYPSALVIYHENTENKSSKIILNSNSKIEGTILCWTERPCIKNRFFIDLKPESLIKGLVICCDAVQSRGIVDGCLMARNTLFVSPSQIQENVLYNTSIGYDSGRDLSQINVLQNTNNLSIMKWLN